MKKLLLPLCLVSSLSAAQEVITEVVNIMDKEPYYGNAKYSRVILLIPESIDRRYFIECIYYKVGSPDSQVVASTHHIARKRTPEWTVKTKVSNIDFALCSGVKN